MPSSWTSAPLRRWRSLATRASCTWTGCTSSFGLDLRLALGISSDPFRTSLTTAGLRVTFPFSASNFSEPKGILYGLEPASGAPIFLDRFGLPNANAVVLAQSGAGKSYAVKVEILRALLNGTDVLVIDPEGEYLQLGEAAGGKCESIGPSDASLPNAFALGSASTTERQLSLLT